MTSVQRAHAAAEAAGLRPITDPVLQTVLTDCPSCDAGGSDPYALWRPLVIACHKPPVRLICRAGCSTTAVERALREPPADWRATAVQWEAIARELLAIAHGLVIELDTARRAPVTADAA